MGSFSNDTEILTENGWFRFEDLPRDLKVATLNPLSHELEYEKPLEYHEEHFSGDMYNFLGRDINQLVVPEHKIYHKHINWKDIVPPWKLKTANSLILNFQMKKNCEFNSPDVENHMIGDIAIPMDLWMEFLGYFISEGYVGKFQRYAISKRTGEKITNGAARRVGISQKKVENLEKMEKCLYQMPFACHRDVGSGQWVYSNKILYDELISFGKARDKYIPDYAKNVSRRQQIILYDALMLGDGSYSQCPTGMKVTYYTSSKQLADDVQELLLRVGFAGDISSIDRIGRVNKTGGITRDIEYRVGIKRTALTPSRPGGGWVPIMTPYSDKVYSLSVPNGIVFVRRNGRACWSGDNKFN